MDQYADAKAGSSRRSCLELSPDRRGTRAEKGRCLCPVLSANVVAVVAARIAASAKLAAMTACGLPSTTGPARCSVPMHTPRTRCFCLVCRGRRPLPWPQRSLRDDRGLPGVDGACESTTAFADAWSVLPGQTAFHDEAQPHAPVEDWVTWLSSESPQGCAVDVLGGAGHSTADTGYGVWPSLNAWALHEAGSVSANG